MKTEITRKDEEKFLKLKIAENGIFDESLSFDDLINAIGQGNLPLEVSDDDGTKIIDDSSIEEIKKAGNIFDVGLIKSESDKELDEDPIESSKQIISDLEEAVDLLKSLINELSILEGE